MQKARLRARFVKSNFPEHKKGQENPVLTMDIVVKFF